MEYSRTILAVVLSLLVIIGYQYFFIRPQLEKQAQEQAQNARQQETAPTQAEQMPEKPKQTPQVQVPQQQQVPVTLSPAPPPQGVVPRKVPVITHLYQMVFTETGGAVESCLLKNYKINLSKDSPMKNLVTVTPPHLPLVLRIGPNSKIDLSNSYFKADKESVRLDGNRDTETLTFTAELSNGIKIQKTFTFHKDSYWVDMDVKVLGREEATSVVLYNKPFKQESRYIFSGTSYYAQGHLEEVKLSDPGENKTYQGPLDWVAYGDNYFMTALIPLDPQGPWGVTVVKRDESGLIETSLSDQRGKADDLRLGLYFGPKEIDRLKALGHNLSKAIDFGWFDPIAKPLLYLLKFLYRFIHNYGLAIIILTVLIKIVFWPLAHKSAQSMKTMQKLQPKLQKLKEKYGDDKERLNRELMQLYKTYKVNPMSGCLPMLVQIPVFFALYKVLLQAIELRHAPFLLWINDLSAPDRLMIPGVHIPYLGGIPVLTILMGVSMYFQQKMSPSSLDPTQAKMMQLLPLIFTFMFINFPSGLVLYWLVNNLLSIAQQYYVNKFTS